MRATDWDFFKFGFFSFRFFVKLGFNWVLVSEWTD